jgi:integrase
MPTTHSAIHNAKGDRRPARARPSAAITSHENAVLMEAVSAIDVAATLVFARADGSAVDPWNFGRAVADRVKRAKVTPITLHGLRDTHASLCAKAGVPLEVVSKRLEHSSIGITAERYLDAYTNRDEAAAAAFGRLVG